MSFVNLEKFYIFSRCLFSPLPHCFVFLFFVFLVIFVKCGRSHLEEFLWIGDCEVILVKKQIRYYGLRLKQMKTKCKWNTVIKPTCCSKSTIVLSVIKKYCIWKSYTEITALLKVVENLYYRFITDLFWKKRIRL